MSKTLSLLVVNLLVAGALSASVGSASAASSSKQESSIVKATNKDRAKHHIKKLTKQKCLAKYAQKQAKTQARKKKMFHQDLQPVLSKCGMRMVGENVAYGYVSAKQLQRAWMNSPGHRSNILNKDFRKIGVGAAKDSRGRWYYATVFGVA